MSTMTVPEPYSALSAHLAAKCTREVSLTFEEIEQLLGVALPPAARLHKEWWTHSDAAADGSYLRAWSQAGRKAYANLFAQSVCFERGAAAPRTR